MSRVARTARGTQDVADRPAEHESPPAGVELAPASATLPATPVPRRRRALDYEQLAPAWRRRMVPVWALVVVAALMLGVGGVAGRSLSEPSDPPATSPTATPPVDPGPSPSRAAIDEAGAAEDPVDAAVGLADEPSTTTTAQASAEASAPVTPDVAKAAVNWVFNRTRAQLVEIIEQDPGVASVERLELDLDADVIRLDFTSSLPNRGREDDTTWALVHRFAGPMFSPENGSFSTELYTPGLAVTTGRSTYVCRSDTMTRLATFAASRTDFENEC